MRWGLELRARWVRKVDEWYENGWFDDREIRRRKEKVEEEEEYLGCRPSVSFASPVPVKNSVMPTLRKFRRIPRHKMVKG